MTTQILDILVLDEEESFFQDFNWEKAEILLTEEILWKYTAYGSYMKA